MSQPPLISSPPKQKPPPKRALPIRSRRIAAQQMGHIPASKSGEILLMKKHCLSLRSSVRTNPTSRATYRLQMLRSSTTCSQLAGDVWRSSSPAFGHGPIGRTRSLGPLGSWSIGSPVLPKPSTLGPT
jgi:hypothetical protein